MPQYGWPTQTSTTRRLNAVVPALSPHPKSLPVYMVNPQSQCGHFLLAQQFLILMQVLITFFSCYLLYANCHNYLLFVFLFVYFIFYLFFLFIIFLFVIFLFVIFFYFFFSICYFFICYLFVCSIQELVCLFVNFLMKTRTCTQNSHWCR